MPAVTATLYQVTDCELRAECKISFPSTEDERISHFLHVPLDDDDSLSMWTAVDVHDSHPHVVLHTRQNTLEIEARCDSVWVYSHGWTDDNLKKALVRLSPSNSHEHVLRSLAPEEPFRIKDKKYLLQVDRTPPAQDIQVMSSRPTSNDANAPAIHGQDSLPKSDRPSTPDPGLGTAVMETPATKRHQDPVPTAPTTSDDPKAPPEEDDQAVAGDSLGPTEQANDIDASNIIDLESKPGLVKAGFDLFPNDDASTQTTESSSQEQPHSNLPIEHEPRANGESLPEDDPIPGATVLAERSPNKRSASQIIDNAGLNEADQPVTAVLSDASAGDKDPQGPPPKKRQKRVSAAATEESQDSVQSTIHVELPSARTEISSVHDSEQSHASSTSTTSTPRNPRKATETPSSNRSRKQGQRGQDSSQDKVTNIVFASSSSLGESTAYNKFLRQHNIKQVKKVNDCDVLCTGKGELKRTSKLLLATLMGKEVVTDQWIIQSADQNQPLDTAKFVPEDKKRKQEWGTSLSEAIKRGREGLKPFEGWTINFTPSAKKELGTSWSELKEICLVAGAAVHALIPRKSPEDTDPTIVIAASNEADQATLDERGWKVFTKDIITFSALRGGIDADSEEFLVAKKGNGSGKKKGKKTR
ncbi:MAG: hypothetical protein Q9168_007660 [Polycauliona sp. 1 TL-2023]